MNKFILKSKNKFIEKFENKFKKNYKNNLKKSSESSLEKNAGNNLKIKVENDFTKNVSITSKKFNKIIKSFYKLDKDFLHIANKCIVLTLYFCLFSCIFLITYKYISIPSLFLIGITFLKYGLIYIFIIVIFTLSFSFIKYDMT